MSRLIPETVFIFDNKRNQWISANKDEVRGFRQAKKFYRENYALGIMMYEPIYEIYTSKDKKYKYYLGEEMKWYICDTAKGLESLREIWSVERGGDQELRTRLLTSLRKQNKD